MKRALAWSCLVAIHVAVPSPVAADTSGGFTLCYLDRDGDLYGDPATEELVPWVDTPVECDQLAAVEGGTAWVSNGLDCDDNPLRCGAGCRLGGDEVCDGYDNDCNPATPDGATDPRLGIACDSPSDANRCEDDGTGCVSGQVICVNRPEGDASRVEVCDPQRIDEDCDGGADDDDPDGPPATGLIWFRDEDGDGYGRSQDRRIACRRPPGYAPIGGDCDDDPAVCGAACAPGLEDVCDGLDNDCNPQTPDGADDAQVGAACDAIGDANHCLDDFQVCSPTGLVCVDNADGDHLRVERCDGIGIDEDCDGGADDEDPDGPPDDAFWWFPDRDGDGFGTNTGARRACVRPEGHAPVGGDCDDEPSQCGARCSPLVVESRGAGNCEDGHDNDCDGLIDSGDACDSATVCFRDLDGDGYGDPATERALPVEFRGACRRFGDDIDPIETLVDNGLDCDDADPDISPDAFEITASDRDENCDGLLACWYDNDDDGYARFDAALVYVPVGVTCESGERAADRKGDCDDSMDRCGAACHEGAEEICDGWDNDCDGLVDNLLACEPPPTPTLDGSGGCGAGPGWPLGLLLALMAITLRPRRRAER